MKALLFLLFLSTVIFASPLKTQYEENLLVGIESDNLGLRTSCAYFLGEYKSDKAIIPLMKMLKSGETEEERILAANSLAKINSKRGMFAIKQRSKFDESPRVRHACLLTYNYMLNN